MNQSITYSETTVDDELMQYAAKYTDPRVDSRWARLYVRPERFIISDSGKIVSLPYDAMYTYKGKLLHNRRKDKLLKLTPDPEGYLNVGIVGYDGVQHPYKVHRLVAQTWIPNPENKPQVNHINGIKWDNRLCNLEWVTNSENQIHAINNGLIHKLVSVKCLDTGQIWPTLVDAARETGIGSQSIKQFAVEHRRHPENLTFVIVGDDIGDEQVYLQRTKDQFVHYKDKRVKGHDSIICLNSGLKFRTYSEAARWAGNNVTYTDVSQSIRNHACCKENVFVFESDMPEDVQRYLDYCYTKSARYAYLASQPIHSQ